jgi:hypothetical protein
MLSKNDGLNQFDSIKRFDDSGNEYWTARELMPLLGYSKWQRFENVIARAKISLKKTNGLVKEHFTHLPGCVSAQGRFGDNYRLSRHACYLIGMNGDSRKPEIAAAQSYFAMKLTAYDYLLQAGFGIKSDVFDFNNFGSQASVDTSGFVYLIKSEGTNFYKIGYSKKLLTRIKDIQVGNPFKIALVHRIFTLNAIELERDLHKYYADYLVRGEWYELTSYMVREFPAIAADLDMKIECNVSKLERLFLIE